MDFGRTHDQCSSVTTESNIRILPLPMPMSKLESQSNTTTIKDTDDEMNLKIDAINSEDNKSMRDMIESMLIQCANQSTVKLFQSENADIANASNYPEFSISRSHVIQPNSLCVIFESFDNLNFVYATPKAIFSNRNGHFHHDDFIDKPFGCKIRSRNNQGLGYVYILRPTTELWTRSLNHRTQIIHELDASSIVFYLNLKPNMVVCESGTGSGSMSHAFMRTIAPYGHLHTFEFNKTRADAARVEFEKNKVSHLVTVYHRDVCGKTVRQNGDMKKEDGEDEEDGKDGGDREDEKTGFQFGPKDTNHRADAVFLDLPEPWLAVSHAYEILKKNGRIGSYSPCVEQSQRTIQKMKEYGFHSIKTIEVRLKEHYVDQVEVEMPPTFRIPDREASLSWNHTDLQQEEKVTNDKKRKQEKNHNDEQNDLKDETKTNQKIYGTNENINHNGDKKKRKIICARPFGTTRGHTAFLTFATAGLK